MCAFERDHLFNALHVFSCEFITGDEFGICQIPLAQWHLYLKIIERKIKTKLNRQLVGQLVSKCCHSLEY